MSDEDLPEYNPRAKAALLQALEDQLKGTRPFDYAAYLAELRRLPEIDYDQEL